MGKDKVWQQQEERYGWTNSGKGSQKRKQNLGTEGQEVARETQIRALQAMCSKCKGPVTEQVTGLYRSREEGEEQQEVKLMNELT